MMMIATPTTTLRGSMLLRGGYHLQRGVFGSVVGGSGRGLVGSLSNIAQRGLRIDHNNNNVDDESDRFLLRLRLRSTTAPLMRLKNNNVAFFSSSSLETSTATTTSANGISGATSFVTSKEKIAEKIKQVPTLKEIMNMKQPDESSPPRDPQDYQPREEEELVSNLSNFGSLESEVNEVSLDFVLIVGLKVFWFVVVDLIGFVLFVIMRGESQLNWALGCRADRPYLLRSDD